MPLKQCLLIFTFHLHSITESLGCYIKKNISSQIVKDTFPAMMLWLLYTKQAAQITCLKRCDLLRHLVQYFFLQNFKSTCGGVLFLVNLQANRQLY